MCMKPMPGPAELQLHFEEAHGDGPPSPTTDEVSTSLLVLQKKLDLCTKNDVQAT